MPPADTGIQPCMERAKCMYILGRTDEACLLNDWALRRWPKAAQRTGEVLSNAGVCMLRRGDIDGARALMTRAYELLPRSPPIKNNYDAILTYHGEPGELFRGSIVW